MALVQPGDQPGSRRLKNSSADFENPVKGVRRTIRFRDQKAKEKEKTAGGRSPEPGEDGL